jgi:hypothetical protein
MFVVSPLVKIVLVPGVFQYDMRSLLLGITFWWGWSLLISRIREVSHRYVFVHFNFLVYNSTEEYWEGGKHWTTIGAIIIRINTLPVMCHLWQSLLGEQTTYSCCYQDQVIFLFKLVVLLLILRINVGELSTNL